MDDATPHPSEVTLPRRKPDAGMNSSDMDDIDTSWHLRVLCRCDEVLEGLSDIIGSLRKHRRRNLNRLTRLGIFPETLHTSEHGPDRFNGL